MSYCLSIRFLNNRIYLFFRCVNINFVQRALPGYDHATVLIAALGISELLLAFRLIYLRQFDLQLEMEEMDSKA
jgi:hypothetical protein